MTSKDVLTESTQRTSKDVLTESTQRTRKEGTHLTDKRGIADYFLLTVNDPLDERCEHGRLLCHGTELFETLQSGLSDRLVDTGTHHKQADHH